MITLLVLLFLVVTFAIILIGMIMAGGMTLLPAIFVVLDIAIAVFIIKGISHLFSKKHK